MPTGKDSGAKRQKESRGISSFLKHYFGGLYNRSGEHHIFLMAGGLAFSLFVCIVPMVLIVFSVVGMVLEKASVASEIDVFIDRVIPYEHYAAQIKTLVFERVDEFKFYKNLAGILGFIGLFFASSGLFSSMRTVLNTAYGLGRNGSALIGKLRDFGMVMLVLLYFLLSTTILPSLEIIGKLSDRVEFLERFRLGFLGDMIFGAVSFLIIFIALIIMYWLIPHGKLRWNVIVVSSLWAAILWEIAKQLFGLYISNVVTLNRIYGTYALLVIVGFWIYYTSIVFILGAEIGQLFRERHEVEEPVAPGHA